MGLFISFEGGEGAGKSTQAELLRVKLEAERYEVVSAREPGGTTLGENIRRWLKGVRVSPQAELMLFAAARAELVSQVIRPCLALHKIVIADRFADSTIAYQGYGRQLPLELVHAVNRAATDGLSPDLTLLLDMPVEKGLQRVGSPQLELLVDEEADKGHGRLEEAGQRRFEQESAAFHRRVRSGYLKLVRQEPDRMLVLDASKPAQVIANAVWERVQPLLASREAKGVNR